MLRMILIAFCLLVSACTANIDISSDDLDAQKDLSPADVEEDLFLSTLEGIHDTKSIRFASAEPHYLENLFWRGT